MSVASPTLKDAQDSTNNPALNPDAFKRQLEKTGATTRTGMTARGAYIKTLLLVGISIVAGAFGWSQVEIVEIAGRQIAMQPAWTWICFIFVMIFGIGAIAAGKAIPIFAIGYAVSYGIILGIASHFYNLEWDGIVLQAVLATMAVFTATLVIYLTGIIKVTGKFVMGVSIAMGALMLLYLAVWLFSLFGVRFTFLFSPTPLGIVFALLIVILAALNLPIDFEFINRSAAAGAPKIMEWYGAFGLMLSIIWMFVSILRLLALIRMSSR